MKKLTLLLMMSIPATLLAQPADLSVCYGKGYILNSKADAVAASGEVNYSWYEDGGLLAGKNDASLTVPAGKALGVHEYVRMAAGEDCPDGVPSNTFTVRVKPKPTISRSGGDAIQNIDWNTEITTIIYTASDDATISLSDGGFPEGVTGAPAGSSFMISGTPSATGTFGYALTAAVNGCTSAAAVGTITVNVSPPPDAASTQTWPFGTQTWSDRIVATSSGCTPTATLSSADPPPKQYKESSGSYYYNWVCVNASAATLCPDPWRVPSESDFSTLISTLGGDTETARETLIDAWGYGGYALVNFTGAESTGAYYWSSTQSDSSDAYYLYYRIGLLNVNTSRKLTGYQVRCVRGI